MFINNTLGKTFFKGWWHQMAFILHTALNNLIYYIFIVIYSVKVSDMNTLVDSL